ncbi:flagellar biosynthesis protein FlhB [Niallia taxi]|uniref:flagellar biosynthesis protein FlhB n=1 Tax=Niallia taxi TaxID=2499688 RepID=UPI0015F6E769|nr:flagellar biosynthesis protein FlhB [Niallia taxi]
MSALTADVTAGVTLHTPTFPLKLDLQFFAGEKTEKATPKKLQDSRKKGQVPKSTDVVSAILMISVFIGLLTTGKNVMDVLKDTFVTTYTEYMLGEFSISAIFDMFKHLLMEISLAVLPILAIAMIAGVVGNFLQIGVLFTGKPLKPDFKKLDPIQGFKRIFSVRSLVELLKSIFKISFIGIVAYLFLMKNKDEIFLLSQVPIGESFSYITKLIFQLGVTVGGVLFVLAIFDFAYQRFDYMKQNRMSKQDIKDEHKKVEGDPLIKAKIKERQRAMSQRRMMADVPTADAVIVNPTHFAVAIKYDSEGLGVPIIVAKGVDRIALKIREIAEENDIVITENIPLARALYAQAEIGDTVPEDLFAAVAEVLAFVYRLKGKVG